MFSRHPKSLSPKKKQEQERLEQASKELMDKLRQKDELEAALTQTQAKLKEAEKSAAELLAKEQAERRRHQEEMQASLALAQTNLKVYEVSERVGFTDYHYFLKIFKKITGFVPTDTRCDNFYHKN